MKIEVKYYDKKISVETDNDDVSLIEIFDILFRIMVQMGFNKETITETFKEIVDEYD